MVLCSKKGLKQQEDITFTKICVLNCILQIYMKQKLTGLMEEIDSSVIIVGDFSSFTQNNG